MNEKYILPELNVSNYKPYLKLMIFHGFNYSISKHEYALLLTIFRLSPKIIDDYKHARLNLLEYYSGSDTISFTALITASNYMESLITDLYRIANTLEKLTKDYPDYLKILPIEADGTLIEIITCTQDLRDDAEHIYNRVIRGKQKSTKKMGAVMFSMFNDSLTISNNKLPIKSLTKWIESIEVYAELISKSFIDLRQKNE